MMLKICWGWDWARVLESNLGGVKSRQSAVQLTLSLARDFCCKGVRRLQPSIQSLGPQAAGRQVCFLGS